MQFPMQWGGAYPEITIWKGANKSRAASENQMVLLPKLTVICATDKDSFRQRPESLHRRKNRKDHLV